MMAVHQQLHICHMGLVSHEKGTFQPPKLLGCFFVASAFFTPKSPFSPLHDQPHGSGSELALEAV